VLTAEEVAGAFKVQGLELLRFSVCVELTAEEVAGAFKV
jgi:hypothetical protein